jgi:hypothetical protein
MTTADIEGTVSIAIDDCNQGNALWLKTYSTTYRTRRKAAPEYRCSDSPSGSMPAAASYSEGI